MEAGNLFEGVPSELPEEVTEVLASGEGKVRIERIVSTGQASPEGFWYEQEEDEWVAVLKGEAVLRFEDPEELLEMSAGDKDEGELVGSIKSKSKMGGEDGAEGLMEMRAGDWVMIPAGCRHRVERTRSTGSGQASEGEETVWIAVFFQKAANGEE